MATTLEKAPWASGPGEILRHGLELLKVDSDRNRRLAIISIDNAVELMMKTFLGLPRRVNGLSMSRKDYDECSDSFPRLLDALEKHVANRLIGIELGSVEWYHRLRNQLYHEGNGLTVERDKVTVYSELAKMIFKNLFGFEIADPADASVSADSSGQRLGEFLHLWSSLEKLLMIRTLTIPKEPSKEYTQMALGWRLHETGDLTDEDVNMLDMLRDLRTKAIHNGNLSGLLKEEAIAELRKLYMTLEQRWAVAKRTPVKPR
jgi:hypothetical protein